MESKTEELSRILAFLERVDEDQGAELRSHDPDHVVLTESLIHALGTYKGMGWTKRALRIMGVKDASKGWVARTAGTKITRQEYLELLEIRDERRRKLRAKSRKHGS